MMLFYTNIIIPKYTLNYLRLINTEYHYCVLIRCVVSLWVAWVMLYLARPETWRSSVIWHYTSNETLFIYINKEDKTHIYIPKSCIEHHKVQQWSTGDLTTDEMLACILNHCYCQWCDYVCASEQGWLCVFLNDIIIKETYAI